MTDKITLTNLGSVQNDPTAVASINANNQAIITAIDNTLSRDGTSPNQMNAILDMNGFNIVNLPPPGSLQSPVRLQDVTSNPNLTIPPTGTAGATVPFLNGNNTWSGTNSFTSTTTAVTADTADNSTKVATTAYVKANTGSSDIAGLSAMGNTGASSAPAAAITGTADQVLAVNHAGTALTFRTISGDVTNNNGVVTLGTVNSNVGSFGSASAVPTVTVNAKGLVTAASSTAVVAPAGTLSGTTLNSTVVTSTLGTVANSVKLGADAASPASSTIAGNSTLTGTSNTAGADFIVQGGKGTGTGAGGKVRISTSPAGGSGSTQNAGVDRLVVDSPGNVIAGSSALTTTSTDGFLYIPTCAGAPTGVPTSQSGHVALVWDTTNHKFWVYDTAWKGGTNPGAWT